MDNRPTPDLVRRWLRRLAAMIGKEHFNTEEEWAEKFDLFVPGLAVRFGPEAFNARSLDAIAVQCHHWPGYALLIEKLAAWLRENRPLVPAIEDAELAALPAEQRFWYASWHRVASSSREDTVRRASLVRRYAPDAWDLLIKRDPGLLAFAPASFREETTSWSDRRAVQQSIETLREAGFPLAATGVLRTILQQRAPQNLPLLEAALSERRDASNRVALMSPPLALDAPEQHAVRIGIDVAADVRSYALDAN